MVPMVLTLTGENSFSLQAELDRLINEVLTEYSDLAVERIDGEDVDFGHLQEAIFSLPFLTAKKMIILRSASKSKQFVENVEQLLAEIPDTTELIIVEPKLDKRQAYYRNLQKKTNFHEFNELDPNGLATWSVSRATSLKASLSLDVAKYLVERIGLNQQLLSNELDKLILYNPKISISSIELLTQPTPQSTIFQLLEAAFSGNNSRVLQLYSEQRALKVEPAQIIAMLSWQLNILAIIKTAGERSIDQIAKDARLNPFVLRKSQTIARKLSLIELKRQIADLLSIDLKSKRTNINSDEALQNYLLRLSK